MADNIALIKLEVQVADGELKVDRLKSKLQQLTKGSDDYNLVVKKIQIAENNLSKTRDKLTKSTQGLIGGNKKGLTGVSQAAGASTSATLELGRVLSDMPYGIRGVANNLQQLASNLFFMSKATDAATGKSVGFMGALKNLLGGLIGPAGILIAFQGIIALFDYFSSGAKKAEDSTEDLTKKLQEQIDTLNDYQIALDTSNLSLDERNGLIKAASISSPEFLKALKDASGALTEQEKALKSLIKEEENDLEVKQKVSQLESVNKGIREEEIKGLDNVRKRIDELTLARNKAFGNADLVRAFQSEIERLEKVEGYYLTQKQLLSEINKLITEGPTEDEKKPIVGSAAWYESQISQLKDKRDKFTKAGSKAYEGLTQEIIKAQEKLKKLTERNEVDIAITFETSDKINEKAKKQANALLKALEDTYGDSDAVKWAKGKLSIPVELDLKTKGGDSTPIIPKEDFEFYAQQYTELMSGVSDFIGAEYDRQLTIEANHTAKLNEELNNRLLNEKLSANERKNIQNQIAINDEALRKKQNAIKKKQFDTQKAFNISMSVANTVSAAISAANQTSGGPVAKIAAMTAVIGAGLANVAMIARQKFQPDAAGVPLRTTGTGGSAGGTGVGDRSFNFNLVGNTLGNQITDAIQGQFDQPLKAYVVSRDITSQQALDANIKGTASF